MAIEKKLICFARLEEFERQLAAGNILDYSIVFIQDAKKIWNRGTYYDCSGEYYAEVYGDTYVGTEIEGTQVWITTNVAENLDAVSARGQLADALDVKTFVENAVQGGGTAVDNVYITDFTVNDLDALIADPMLSIPADIPRMYDAMSAHKVVLVPYDSNEGTQGYGVATGYHEDLFYVTITLDNGRYIDLEVNHDADGILGQQVRQRVWHDKQDALVSGTNIKTINGTSILGSGDITIEGGSGSVTDVQVDGTSVVNNGVATIRKATVALYGVTKLSTSVSSTSNETVPTSGTIKKVYDLANGKQDKLTSGTNIKTINGQSILGSGDITISGGGVSQDYVDNTIANAITTTLNTAV